MNKSEIKQIIEKSLEELVACDNEILEININERTISHRLAVYLEKYFNGWSVDCEYNRDHDDIKILDRLIERNRTNDTEAKTVFPDIIVHKRMSNENLLVIEMKKSTNTSQKNRDKDEEKLKAFKRELGYDFAVFIDVGVGDSVGNNPIDFIEE